MFPTLLFKVSWSKKTCFRLCTSFSWKSPQPPTPPTPPRNKAFHDARSAFWRTGFLFTQTLSSCRSALIFLGSRRFQEWLYRSLFDSEPGDGETLSASTRVDHMKPERAELEKMSFLRREILVDRIFFWSWKMSFWNSSFPRFFLDNFGVSYRWRPFFLGPGWRYGWIWRILRSGSALLYEGRSSFGGLFCRGHFRQPIPSMSICSFPYTFTIKIDLKCRRICQSHGWYGQVFFPEKKTCSCKKNVGFACQLQGVTDFCFFWSEGVVFCFLGLGGSVWQQKCDRTS